MLIFFLKSKTKTWEHNFGDAVAMEFISRERVSDFSLEIHAIGPLDFDGARREAVLRGEDNAWTPDLGVFDNSKR